MPKKPPLHGPSSPAHSASAAPPERFHYLGEVKLKVVKGQVTLDIVTKDVAITLVRRGDKWVDWRGCLPGGAFKVG